jgi:predicted ribosomally synthesized peptide with SipW-like signal peptide
MKKILSLSIILVAVIALLSTGTWAYFSDVEQATGNLFAAGTLDLKTNDQNGVTAVWNVPTMAPGDPASSGTIHLKNAGSVAADHLEIKFATNATNVPTDPERLVMFHNLLDSTHSSSHATSSDTASTLIDNTLTQATGYWIGKTLFIGGGSAAGQARYISAFDNATHKITVDHAFGATPDTSSYYAIANITGTSTAAGTATTLVDATYLTQADDYWVGKTVHFLSGTHNGENAVITTSSSTNHSITFASITTASGSGTKYLISEVDNTDISSLLTINSILYDGASIASSFPNNAAHLSDLNGATYSAVSPVAGGTAAKDLVISVQLPATAGNGSQGDSVSMDVTFGLMQTSGQHLP